MVKIVFEIGNPIIAEANDETRAIYNDLRARWSAFEGEIRIEKKGVVKMSRDFGTCRMDYKTIRKTLKITTPTVEWLTSKVDSFMRASERDYAFWAFRWHGLRDYLRCAREQVDAGGFVERDDYGYVWIKNGTFNARADLSLLWLTPSKFQPIIDEIETLIEASKSNREIARLRELAKKNNVCCE